MHPAFSVIFFTSASGAGYGMLAVLGVMAAMGWLPADKALGAAGLGVAFLLVTSGLLSSTFHLGHPERAWRAFTQWRTSWLSREGVASVATYGPWALFAYLWLIEGSLSGPAKGLGFLAAVSALVTIYCTAMIYASLRTVHQWANGWTVPLYMILGLTTGTVWVGAILGFTVGLTQEYVMFAIVAVLIGWRVQRHYWQFIDTTRHPATPASATGLKGERVREFEKPHTEENYLLSEMGFKIGRKHAEKLRQMVHILGFGVPLGVLFVGYFMGGIFVAGAFVCAALSMSTGIVISRWLFFAEARHVVTLYYGAERA